ncbi:MAG: rhomboid family intramembrane serine protease [Chitinophagaceae bacterium]
MFFPIGDVNVTRGVKPVITPLFIGLNIAVFIWMFQLSYQEQDTVVRTFGCVPADLREGRGFYTLISSLFLHGGWMHLIGNMLFMWVFADNIESTIGYKRFLFFYLGGGIVATLTHAFFSGMSSTPLVGASGAIAACLGAYMVMFPGSKIKVLFLLFLTSFRVPAFVFLGIWMVQQTWAGLGSLGTMTSDTSGVAYWAHIGGFVFGLIMGFIYYPEAKKAR